MTTTPLTKAIATLEGIVLAGAAAVPWVVSLVDPATLSKPDAAKWSVASAVALGICRSAIKVVALVKTATGIGAAPIDVEALAKNVVAHAGVMVPSTSELQKIVAEAIKLSRETPAAIIHQVENVAAPVTPVPPVSEAPTVA